MLLLDANLILLPVCPPDSYRHGDQSETIRLRNCERDRDIEENRDRGGSVEDRCPGTGSTASSSFHQLALRGGRLCRQHDTTGKPRGKKQSRAGAGAEKSLESEFRLRVSDQMVTLSLCSACSDAALFSTLEYTICNLNVHLTGGISSWSIFLRRCPVFSTTSSTHTALVSLDG